jgi:hypothetical protein
VLSAHRINALHDAHHNDPAFVRRRNVVVRRGVVASRILHADRRHKLCSSIVASEPRRQDMVGSMGCVGAADDDAATKSFWSRLQSNVLNRRQRPTGQEPRLAIVVWIEQKCHRQRPQDALDGSTPIDFEAERTEPQSLAAWTESVTSSCLTPDGLTPTQELQPTAADDHGLELPVVQRGDPADIAVSTGREALRLDHQRPERRSASGAHYTIHPPTVRFESAAAPGSASTERDPTRPCHSHLDHCRLEHPRSREPAATKTAEFVGPARGTVLSRRRASRWP